MQSPKKLAKVIEFPRPLDVADRIEIFVDKLLDSNELLAGALTQLRDFHLAGAPPRGARQVFAEVELALAKASWAKNGF